MLTGVVFNAEIKPIMLTLSCIMLRNDQTWFENNKVKTSHDKIFKAFGHFLKLRVKWLKVCAFFTDYFFSPTIRYPISISKKVSTAFLWKISGNLQDISLTKHRNVVTEYKKKPLRRNKKHKAYVYKSLYRWKIGYF